MQSNSLRKAPMNPIQSLLRFYKTPVYGKAPSPTPTSLPSKKALRLIAFS